MMSGFGYWSHDIGGFEGTLKSDLYKRWLAFGLFSSHSRLHGSNTYRVPYIFDSEAILVCEKFTKEKEKLFPYIYSNAIYTSETGIPFMRPLVLEFQDDYNTSYIEREYMFGDSILVSPIFSENGDVDFYLPKSNWTNYFTNELAVGERWYHKKYDYFSLPVYVKENSIIPVIEDKKIVNKIYGLNKYAKRCYLDDEKTVEIEVSLKDNILKFKVKNADYLFVELINPEFEIEQKTFSVYNNLEIKIIKKKAKSGDIL